MGIPLTGAHTEAQDPVQVGGPPLVSFAKVYTTCSSALAITQPRLECRTMSTVVPGGRTVNPALLLACASAVCLDDELEDELEDVAVAAADDDEDAGVPEL